MIVPLRKNRSRRRIMRRAAVAALLAGEPVCSSCTGWGTLEDHEVCHACSGQGVSESVAREFAIAREQLQWNA